MTRQLWTPLADLRALVALVALFRKQHYKVVHTHTPKASLLGQLAAFIARVPIRVYTIHGFFFLETSSWRRKLLFGIIERMMAFLVHRALFVNREDIEVARRLRIYPASKIAYVGGDIDVEYFDPKKFSPADRERKRRELGVSPGRKIVGIVARLVWEKGYADLFEAFWKVLTQHPEAFLLVVGPEESDKTDGFTPALARQRYGLSARDVLFAGERTDTADLYSIMDIYVLPSCREGLGLSLLEASAMELPVVATDIRGCREAVENDATGILVPSKSPMALARAILTLVKDRKKAAEMGRRGRIKILREFEKRKVLRRIEEEYARLIQERL